MKTLVFLLAATLLALVMAAPAVAQNFYDSSVEPRNVVVDLQADYGANGLGDLDDTTQFQSAIDFVSGLGGGA